MDKRHLSRIKTVQELFSIHFRKKKTRKVISAKAQVIFDNIEKIDSYIKAAAPKFPVEKIALVDLSILRLATYELMIENTIPPKVVINEAVELAKDMGAEKAPGFVNAVLGTIYNEKII